MELWERIIREPGIIRGRLLPILKASSFTQGDFDNLDSRFSPYASFTQYSKLEIWALLGYLAEGAFLMECLPPYIPKRSVDHIWVKRNYPESGHHLYLKRVATRWLKVERNIKKIEYEKHYPGGISDVASSSGRWVVECGCCKPGKIFNTFRLKNSIHRKLVLLSSEGVTIFRAGPNIEEYIKIANTPIFSIAPIKNIVGFKADEK